jgi:hypothetical protein
MTEMTVTSKLVTKEEVGYLGYTVHTEDRPHDWRRGVGLNRGQLAYLEAKSTQNDGCFVPGQYRVNPYSVCGGAIQVDGMRHGSMLKADLGTDQFSWPGIPAMYLALAGESTPIYLVTVAFINSYWLSYGGYKVGDVYYHNVYAFGDWWRYDLPNKASDSVIPHTSDDYEQLALQKAYGKLRSADLDLGEDLGEIRETIQMLKDPLSGLRKFLLDDRSRNLRLLLAFKRKDVRELKLLTGRTGEAAFESFASTWLELRYGLRPLIKLVQNVIERVRDKNVEVLDPDRIRSVRTRLTFGPIETMAWSQATYGGVANIRSKFLVEDTYYASASVQYKQTSEQGYLDALGLTPRFLPETAWALTGCSFVADWIFSIGPWLATLRINPDITVLGNTTGFKHHRKVSVITTQMGTTNTYPNVPWTTLKDVHPPGADACIVTEKYDRRVNVDLSYLPHFTWGRTLDLFKAVDALLILWQFAKIK